MFFCKVDVIVILSILELANDCIFFQQFGNVFKVRRIIHLLQTRRMDVVQAISSFFRSMDPLYPPGLDENRAVDDFYAAD